VHRYHAAEVLSYDQTKHNQMPRNTNSDLRAMSQHSPDPLPASESADPRVQCLLNAPQLQLTYSVTPANPCELYPSMRGIRCTDPTCAAPMSPDFEKQRKRIVTIEVYV